MKILIIRLSSLGDIILTFPLITNLKFSHPESNIDYITGTDYADLFKCVKGIDNLILFDKEKGAPEIKRVRNNISDKNYDVIIDLHNNFRSFFLRAFQKSKKYIFNKHSIKKFLLVKFKLNLLKNAPSISDRYLLTCKELIYLNDKNHQFSFNYSEELKNTLISNFEFLFNIEKNKKIIGFCPLARHFTKIYPAEKFIQIGKALNEQLQPEIVIFGEKNEFNKCEEIRNGIGNHCHNLAGKLSISEIVAALDCCDLVISNDTGLMHIAAFLNKNLITIFGSSVKEFGFFPINENSNIFEVQGLSCRPCSHIGREVCPKGHFKCMEDLSSQKILLEVVQILKNQ